MLNDLPIRFVTILLCIYGVLKEFRPSEPFLYQFQRETLNISSEVLSSQIYPVWTYGYLLWLLPTFLVSDLLFHRPLIIVEALAYLVCWILFDCALASTAVQQVIELIYGCATATEIAYLSYIYLKVNKEDYPWVTSLTRSALLLGKFLSYLVSQLIVALSPTPDYRLLNYISTGSLVLALITACLLPDVKWRRAYAKRLEENPPKRPPLLTYGGYVKYYFSALWTEFKTIYSSHFVIKWSVWWALASCVNYQIGNYTQTLWGLLQKDSHDMWNGITEALCPLLAFPTVLLMQRIRVDWRRWGDLMLFLFSILDAGLLFLLSQTNQLYLMYAGYIVYRVLYQAIITIAQFNLASLTSHSSMGILFGFNTFIALALQSILTLVVADKHGLSMAIRDQYLVYACIHLVIAALFLTPVFLQLGRLCGRRRDGLSHSNTETAEETATAACGDTSTVRGKRDTHSPHSETGDSDPATTPSPVSVNIVSDPSKEKC